MTVRLLVAPRRLDAAENEVAQIVGRLRDPSPAGRLIHGRWLESEKRTFRAGRFRPRKASTLERYQRAGVGSGMGRARRPVSSPGGRVLVLSGRLRDSLTTAGAPGQLDDQRRTTRGLSLKFGAKPKGRPGPRPRGPLGYAHLLARHGRDPVSIDTRAVADSTDDVTDYILHGRAGR
jgi:hypothetical protein